MQKAKWAVIGGFFGTVVLLMAQISAQDAKSNIGSWLNLFGFNSEWIQSGNIDIIVTVLGVSILVVVIIILLPKVIQNRLSGNKLMYIPGIIFIVIGITWVTVAYLNSGLLSKNGINANAETGFTISNQKQLVETLKKYATAKSKVQIHFVTIKYRSLADSLISIFELAGWQTDLTNVQLEFGLQATVVGYIVGVHVKGGNVHLVESIAKALAKSGLEDVKPEIIQTNISRDNPKWKWVQHRIEITIGHHKNE